MTGDTIDSIWPRLEQAELDQEIVILSHPNMRRLLQACAPFFSWMHASGHEPGSGITVTGVGPWTVTADGYDDSVTVTLDGDDYATVTEA